MVYSKKHGTCAVHRSYGFVTFTCFLRGQQLFSRTGDQRDDDDAADDDDEDDDDGVGG